MRASPSSTDRRLRARTRGCAVVAAAGLAVLAFGGVGESVEVGVPAALTPRQADPPLTRGHRVSLSERGQFITVDQLFEVVDPDCFEGCSYEDPDTTGGRAGLFDYSGADPDGSVDTFSGLGIAISGDGCTVLRSRLGTLPLPTTTSGSVPGPQPQPYDELTVQDRCTSPPAPERSILSTQDVPIRMALSHSGQWAAVGWWADNGESWVDVIDLTAATPDPVRMPLEVYTEARPELGLDISDGGIAVVTTTDVYFSSAGFVVTAWNAATASEPRRIVGPDSDAGGWTAFPSISDDGRWISFASTQFFPGDESHAGPWVFVNELADLDGPETPPENARLISAEGDSAIFTSMSRDASQVAFAVGEEDCTGAAGEIEIRRSSSFPQEPEDVWQSDYEFTLTDLCRPSGIEVAYSPEPGFATFETDTIFELPPPPTGTAPSPFVVKRFEPTLSGNGRWLAWLNIAEAQGEFDPFASLQAFRLRRDAGLTATDIDVGTIMAGSATTATSSVTNTGLTSVGLDRLVTTDPRFSVVGGSCTTLSSLTPGMSCIVEVALTTGTVGGPVTAELVVGEVGYDAVEARARLTANISTTTTSTTTTSTTTTIVEQEPPIRVIDPKQPPVIVVTTTTSTTSTTIAPAAQLTVQPGLIDFGDAAFGIPTLSETIRVTNIGNGPARLTATLTGTDPGDFEITGGSCRVIELAPGRSCEFEVRMTATAGGVREARLEITADRSTATVRLTGRGRFEPRLATSPSAVVERGVTAIIGQGFPPNSTITVVIERRDGTPVSRRSADPTEQVEVTTDGLGAFRFPVMPFDRLGLGPHDISVAGLPDVHDGAITQLMVVLDTFEPQGPGAAAFGDSLIVARG